MEEKWTAVISSDNKWFDFNLKELAQYKDLIWLLVKRNYTTRYKQTILGPLWLLISPLFTTIIFAVVFGGLAGMSTDHVPQLLFYMSGNIIWTFFSVGVQDTSSTFVRNADVFGKVYFPRLVTPISTIITAFMDFCIQFVLFMAIFLFYVATGTQIHINAWVLYTPILLLQLGLLSMGFGIIISALTTKYRDLTVLVGFGLQLWMYFTPIVYSVSVIPEKLMPLFMANPVAPIVLAFKYAFLGIGEMSWWYLGMSWIVTAIVVFVGVLLFNRVQKTFMDTV